MAQQRLPRKHNDHGRDVEAALGALDAEELRALVGETLDGLDRSQRGPIEDRLLRRAAARGGYRPTPPAPQIVGEVLELVMAARRVGYADPLEIDEYLRSGVTASLAGEHATARRILGALLLPIAEAEMISGSTRWSKRSSPSTFRTASGATSSPSTSRPRLQVASTPS